ncbi:MAG: helix-turn-helix transcriptional regulator [Actinomycetota bacterium]
MSRSWNVLSSHGMALRAIARRPHVRIRDLAAELGVTERAAQGLVSDLVASGAVERFREGRRNRYVIRGAAPGQDSGSGFLTTVAPPTADQPCEALVLACSDYRIVPTLVDRLAREGLLGRSEIVLWPGGGPALAGRDRGHLFEVLTALGERRHPRRVVLVSHTGCAVPDIPRVAGATAFATHRAMRRWASRFVGETQRRLGIRPELWLIDRGRVGGVSSGPTAAARPADRRQTREAR